MKSIKKTLLSHQKILVAFITVVFLFFIFLLNSSHPASFWLEYWFMFPIAFAIALTVNTVGISGAALFVPFFILIFPLLADPLTSLQSVQLGLITESFGLSSSALAFLAFGLVDLKLAKYSILGALPLVILGVLLSTYVPESILNLMVAVLLIISVFLMKNKEKFASKRLEEKTSHTIDMRQKGHELVTLVAKDKKTYHYCRTKSGYKKRFFGYGIGGFFQGAVGFGIGELGIISMLSSKIPLRIAIGTSHLIVATTAISASILHFTLSSQGNGLEIPWNIPIMTVPAVILGGQIAPFIAAKLSNRFLENLIAFLFTSISIFLVLLSLGFI